LTEKQIIKGCIKNNAECQRILFDKYSQLLMAVCLRYSGDVPGAEDMLQEAFIKVFSSIQQYRFEGSFEGWIRRVTVNTCLRKLQQTKIRFDDLSKVEDEQVLIHDDAFSRLTEKALIRMISSLPRGYRVVFNLNGIEGYNHDEIAALLGIEAATSRSQLAKARKLLQQQISAHQNFFLKYEE